MRFLNTGTLSSTSADTVETLRNSKPGAIAVIVGRGNEVLRTYEKIRLESLSDKPDWKVHEEDKPKPTIIDSRILASIVRTYPYRLVLFDDSFEAFAALASGQV